LSADMLKPTEETLRAGISRWSLLYNRWPSESPVWPNNRLVLKNFGKSITIFLFKLSSLP